MRVKIKRKYCSCKICCDEYYFSESYVRDLKIIIHSNFFYKKTLGNMYDYDKRNVYINCYLICG